MSCCCNELHECMIDLHYDSIFSDSEDEVASLVAPFTSSQDIFPYVNSLKEEGNSCFKLGQVSKALSLYTRAISVLVLSIPCCSHNMHPFYELAIRLNLNIAACAIKMSKFDWARRLCSCVLQFEPSNVKALFRRGSASMGLGQLQAAKLDLEAAGKFEPNNKEILREWEKLDLLLANSSGISKQSSENVGTKAVKKPTKVNQLNTPGLSFNPLKIPSMSLFNFCDHDGSESVASNMSEVDAPSLDGCTANSRGSSYNTIGQEFKEKVPDMISGQNCPAINTNLAEPKFRFSNRSRPGSMLNISPPDYKKLANGQIKCYIYPRSTCFMTVRTVVKDPTTLPMDQDFLVVTPPSTNAMDIDFTSATMNDANLGNDTRDVASKSCVSESCISSVLPAKPFLMVDQCTSMNSTVSVTSPPFSEPQMFKLVGSSSGVVKPRSVKMRARARHRNDDNYHKKSNHRNLLSGRAKLTLGSKRKGWSNQFIKCYPPWKKRLPVQNYDLTQAAVTESIQWVGYHSDTTCRHINTHEVTRSPYLC